MSQRVKCNDADCESCKRGKFLRSSQLEGRTYYCKALKKEVQRHDAKDCLEFRCRVNGHYYCKTCRGGK